LARSSINCCIDLILREWEHVRQRFILDDLQLPVPRDTSRDDTERNALASGAIQRRRHARDGLRTDPSFRVASIRCGTIGTSGLRSS
jgi:hypothetical protein